MKAKAADDRELVEAGAVAFWRRRASSVDGGASRTMDGLLVACTGLAEDLNVALVRHEPRHPTRAILSAEAWLGAHGWPLGLELEDRRHPTLERAAGELGFRAAIHRPAMTLRTLERRPVRRVRNVVMRRAGLDDLEGLRMIETGAFDSPPSVAKRLITPRSLSTRGLRAFIALDDGEPVGAAWTSLHRGGLGVFGVAVVPRARGRGIGTAITTRAIAASSPSARFAWLNPTEEAGSLYQRMGFRLLSEWSIWLRDEERSYP